LKLWSVIRTYGVKGLQNFIRIHIKFAEELEEWISKDDRFEIVQPRVLSLVTFRVKLSNEFNQKLEERLNESGKILISHAVTNEKYFLRFAIGGTNTERRHVEQAWQVVQTETTKLQIDQD